MIAYRCHHEPTNLKALRLIRQGPPIAATIFNTSVTILEGIQVFRAQRENLPPSCLAREVVVLRAAGIAALKQ